MATDDQGTAKFSYTPLTVGGFPNIADGNFDQGITQAASGGSATQNYFSAGNQTADFWKQIGSGSLTFADGVDPSGNPIKMASSGNVNMRLGAFYSGTDAGVASATADDPPPIFGIATVQTMNTTTNLSRDISFAIGLVSIPGQIVITKALFADLLKPLYNNFTNFLKSMASKYQQATETEDPSIDPEEENEDPLEDASTTPEQVGGELAEEGVETMTINWANVGLEAAGMGALVAIPMVIGFLGHKMINSVTIVNNTNLSFTWSILTQVEGKTSVSPDPSTQNVIPALSIVKDAWGDVTTVKCAYEANFQFINSSDLGSIGYVLGLTPSDGGTQAKLVVSVPWAGQNSIWVGQSNDDPTAIYNEYSTPAQQQLSTTASFSNYQIQVGLSALSGETGGNYFYGVMVTITPVSS